MNNAQYNKNQKAENTDLSDFSGMSGSVAKAKDTKKTIKMLLTYSKKYLPGIIIAVIAAVAGTIIALVGPGKLKVLTNLITEGIPTIIDMPGIVKIGILLIALYLTSALLNTLQGWIMATVTQKISQKMRIDISRKINRLPMWFYHKNTTGDILSRITNDVDSLGQNLNNSLTTLVTSITMLTGSLIMMFITNWTMTLAAIASVVLGFITMMIIMSKSQKHFDNQQKYLGLINGHIEETYTGHLIVKAYNGEQQMFEPFKGLNKKLNKSTYMAQFLSGLMMPIMTFVDNISYVAVIVVGASLVISGQISFGVIVAFLVYVRYFTQPLTQIAQLAQGLQMAVASGERVFEFLDAEEMADEKNKKAPLQNVKGHVEFKNVKFSYEGTDKMVINNFSAIAKPGQKIAIVGPTGSGKTTLVNLLMRFNEINSGDILIDGVPIRQMTRAQVHSLFCMVLQDTWLFEGTIRENIVYNKQNVSDEDLKKACALVGLHHFIRTLPNGYDTVLNDKVNLSAGQRQQITIARTMIDNAPMLILDEATSSIDTRTEVMIQNAMDKLMEGRTSFVIAHRLSTIKNADIILVLKDGDIIESGSHTELIEKNGFYAELYNSQFEVA
ncbi:ABC transporter ATP-binding protein [Eubacterium callanderi]|uniref:Putative ABC transporter ATP-binding protein n=1 Tax=Eubacterium limosum TaxID=1736 RepID=A0A6N3E3T2_EUBLI|nr:ABC transporter ATP-binding protein [Eubacterium callanderi]MDR4075996.1 ABC transporter ATP-binding protein [Eubacterium sp.]WPK66063.1 putative ABC transporter ATP-binding protein [Eubacterium callanderi]WPK70361.1 putative ABC transporter ATP-binding protein [Eubacterium callanderi]GFZ24605.1 ABC transporter [[Clostridium] methoxybenzovorans]